MFKAINGFVSRTFDSAAVVAMIGIYLLLLLIPLGEIYWLWMAFQLGSFWMFVLGLAGPTILFAAPIGAYSLIFGTPDWVFSAFA